MTSTELAELAELGELSEMGVFSPLDGVVLAILLVALARGFYIGLIREGFSIAALTGGFLAVRYFTGPVAIWLVDTTKGEIGQGAAPWVAGALVAIASAGMIAFVGRWLRRGVKAVGLGWADRLGGTALGAAEGVLVAALLVLAATWWLGNQHPAVADSRSVVAYHELQGFVRDHAASLPDVAAPLRLLSD